MLPLLVFAVLCPQAYAQGEEKLDDALKAKAKRSGWSRAIVTWNGQEDSAQLSGLGGRLGRRLELINGQVIELPNGQLKKLAALDIVARIDEDRPTLATMATVSTVVGARAVQKSYGYDGAGIGIAVIDSGITSWHDDLTSTGPRSSARSSGNQRVVDFVDFVNGRRGAYDDNGHGTHVAGVIAGNGYDSGGAQAGIAPASHLVSLKVLDEEGRGVISDVIAALEYAVRNRAEHNIRVINLSVGAAVTSSYNVDPLTIAAKRAVDAGMVVVTAAGNFGRNSNGDPQYGGITAPGNAPWVLTVGAMSHNGTLTRIDDTIAPYSSRGPSAYDFAAKPDIVAPGTGVVSLSDPSSRLYKTMFSYTVDGTVSTPYRPYLSLSGTSMAAPVVSGTVALMIQANPGLTPNLVKAALQVHRRDLRAVRPADAGGRRLEHEGGRRSGPLLRDREERRPVSGSANVEPAHHLGQSTPAEWSDQPARDCLDTRRCLGRRERPFRREHRLGHEVRRRDVLQHRLGHRAQ